MGDPSYKRTIRSRNEVNQRCYFPDVKDGVALMASGKAYGVGERRGRCGFGTCYQFVAAPKRVRTKAEYKQAAIAGQSKNQVKQTVS